MNSKLTAAVKYRLLDSRKAIITFYGILIVLSAAIGIGATSVNYVSVSISGGEMATGIFIFVLGLTGFRDNFRLMLQNGLSRRTMFFSYAATALALSAGLSLLVNLINVCGKLLFAGHPNIVFTYTTEMMYAGRYADGTGQMQIFMESFLFFFCLYASIMAGGYLITTVFYRLSRAGKIAVGVAVPAFFIFVLPIFDGLVAGGRISMFLFTTITKAFGLYNTQNPFIAMGSCLFTFALFSGLEWLAARHAVIKD